MIDKLCKVCNKEFKVRKYREFTAKYCSQECSYKDPERLKVVSDKLKGRTVNPKTLFKSGHKHSDDIKEKMKGSRPNAKPWNKKEDVYITCLYCGTSKKVRPASSDQKYCSKDCANNARNKGRTSLQKRLRQSTLYKLWRKAVFQRDNYTCVICNVRGGTLNADHIKRFADYPELRFDINNGRTLCKECHLKTDTYGNRKNSPQVSGVV